VKRNINKVRLSFSGLCFRCIKVKRILVACGGVKPHIHTLNYRRYI